MSTPIDFNKLITKAETCKFCINCSHSYIQPEYGTGYCRWTKNGKSKLNLNSIKPIKEFDTCTHWKKK